ncbi:glycine dehydrogenase (aminomethyl-transferring) [Paramagnetospirillum marisnigri]|uniref:glycine dehydrogenase (aminomethyl-transferring) n=1 Tax=Paramagnetospirillum marisnigri TaxID=1285242 RepID=A0A178MCU1_9PROT|nr:aminomethyl-transferring glycine dehydrogenase subunit GcvPB [Paramagnetospirillum marisnigri]OAN46572.1 glycine dehydrogenase (aminomethyl-transferring) [Paramagnetospirillum marisnigri]
MSETTSFSGNKGLQIEEKLIFEMGNPGAVAVDLPEPGPVDLDRMGGVRKRADLALPDLSEPQVVRHYTRLSQKNYGIDTGFYPLGSCTMKHNPRLSEKVARLPGLADLHPFQPRQTVQGALEVIDQLAWWLKQLTGMPAVAMSPAAGAHGEWCGLMAIRAAHEDSGQGHRRRVLVPESAHGTNPATAAMCGYSVDPIPAKENGRVDLDALKAKLGPDVAALMLTNPNTCGLFESEIIEIAAAVHGAGAYFYCDGANFNAIVGRVKVADLGIDAMHINLHKTFSTPHGGGGPGAGPTVLSAALAPFAPVPYVVSGPDGLELVEGRREGTKPFGRVKGFHGQFGVFVRALAYILSMGADGLRQASSDAVLNANYLQARLGDVLTPSFDGPCMHEALFDDRFLKDTGVTTLDFAKALIDEGYHPMTMYFPLVVHGALLMEPTETESKEALDQFIAVVRGLAEKAKAGAAEDFKAAPRHTPRRRLDETLAARTPILRWKA